MRGREAGAPRGPALTRIKPASGPSASVEFVTEAVDVALEDVAFEDVAPVDVAFATADAGAAGASDASAPPDVESSPLVTSGTNKRAAMKTTWHAIFEETTPAQSNATK